MRLRWARHVQVHWQTSCGLDAQVKSVEQGREDIRGLQERLAQALS